MVREIERGVAQGIIAWHPDRLARNSIDGGKIIYLLDDKKLLDLKFPQFWFDTTPQGKFMLGMAFNQSKYYVDNLSENVRRGLRQKIRNGVYPGKAPYGYINNSKTRGIDVDGEKLKAIKKGFELFSEGNKTFTDIATFLYKFGLKRKIDKPLHINQIRQILSDRFYIGIMYYNGEYHEGTHKTIISKELFQKVQKLLEFRNRHKKRRYNFAFMGLLKCGECGATRENIEKLEQELKDIDVKLNKLLDGYLEGIIDPEIYKTKKNEFFEEKLKINEELEQIKQNGSSWLEPMRQWIGSALSCAKIARAKNTSEELASL